MDLYTYAELVRCPEGGYVRNTTPAKGQSISWSDIERFEGTVTDKKAVYVIPKLLSGSDAGPDSLVQRSNFRSFLRDHKRKAGVHEIYGGYGSYGLAIRLDRYETTFKDIFDQLESFCLYDEEDHSELEHEEQNRAWEEDFRDEVKETLQKNLEGYLGPDIDFEDDEIDELFYLASEETATYWEDDGGRPWIRLDRLMPNLEDLYLVRHFKDLPLLVGREWHSNHARNLFEAKLKGAPA